jgi:hypothetical protein
MSREPFRLIDEGDLALGERALLEAGGDGAPFAYDVDAGAARFRASLAALGAAGAVATAHGTMGGSAAVGGKTLFASLLLKVGLGVAAGAALFVGGTVIGAKMAERTAPPAAVAPASQPVAASPALPRPVDPASAARGADSGPTATAHAPAAPDLAPVTPASSLPTDRTGAEHGKAQASALSGARTSTDRGTTTTATPRTSSRAGAPGAETTAGATGASSDDVAGAKAAAPAAASAPTEATRPQPASAHTADAPAQLPAATASATPAPTADAPAAQPTDSLRELRALAVARNLVDRDPDAALAALDRMGRDYPKGYFVEERQALTVLALAGAGRSSAARQQAASFLRTFPNGPFSERVRAVLRASN